MSQVNMPENSIAAEVNSLNELLSDLPQPYEFIDKKFLKKNAKIIEAIKKRYENKGGIRLIDVDDTINVMCKIPDSAILDQVKIKIKTMDNRDVDNWVVAQCLLYPSPDTFRSFLDSGMPGLGTTISGVLMKEAKFNMEATAKKL
jgi:hypothetical protein